MHLSSLSPFGPIFAKELRAAARRKRNYLLRVAYLGVLLLFLLLAYGSTSEWGPSGVAARARQQEALGWAFFLSFSFFSVGAMALIGPVLTSTAISGERLHKTFHVLLMTPINAWQIASGKLFSRLLTALVLMGLSLPVLALVRLLGGVELSDMFGIICLAATTCMATAALGLLYSTLLNRTYVVILLSYATLIFVYLFIPFIFQLAILAWVRNGPPGPWFFTWFKILSATNPIVCTATIVAGAPPAFRSGWLACVMTHLAVTALLLLLTGLLLRRLARREGEGAAAQAKPTALAVGPTAIPSPFPAPALISPGDAALPPPPLPSVLIAQHSALGRQRERERRVWDNPVLWRELRKPLLRRLWQRYTVAGTVLFLLLLTYAGLGMGAGELDDPDVHVGYAFVFHTLFMLVLCVLSGTAIAQEKESDTWTVLLATPTSARAIVLGKLAGILARLGWPMGLIALHFIIFAIAGVITWRGALLTLWVIVTFNSIWIATGLYLSLRVAKVTTAVICNLLLPVLFYGGISLGLVTIEELYKVRDFSENCTWYLPYFYQMVAIDGLHRASSAGQNTVHMPGMNAHGTPDEFVQITFIVGLVHLLVAGLLIAVAISGFNRIVGRAGQNRMWMREPQSITE